MTNHIQTKLEQLSHEGRPGLMTHAVIGYPTLEQTVELGNALDRAGADFIELQIPFSDPLADGPSIRGASEVALANGTRVRDAFMVAERMSRAVAAPLIFMTYFNIVHKYGVEAFCVRAAKSGVSGLIVPDAPIEEAEHEGLLEACNKTGLHYIPVLAPTSTDERIHRNGEVAAGLVYCMSRKGVTGTQAGFDADLAAYVRKVRELIEAPVALGFGVSEPEHVRQVASLADVIVVGSAIVDGMREAAPGQEVTAAGRLVMSLAAQINPNIRYNEQ